MPVHAAPSLQKVLSQQFRAGQASAGNGVSMGVARLWNAGFSIKEARSSWGKIRPSVAAMCARYYNASQASGRRYYDACRISAGLGPLPASVSVPALILSQEHIGNVIDPCGLGAFLHQVKVGAMMMDAYTSAKGSLMSAVATLVMSGARDWIAAAAKADPKSEGVRRVTSGTCSYCEALAEEGTDAPGQGFHNDCECTNEPAFNGDTGASLPNGGTDIADLEDIPGLDDDIPDVGYVPPPDGTLVPNADDPALKAEWKAIGKIVRDADPGAPTQNAGVMFNKLIKQYMSGNPLSIGKNGANELSPENAKMVANFFEKLIKIQGDGIQEKIDVAKEVINKDLATALEDAIPPGKFDSNVAAKLWSAYQDSIKNNYDKVVQDAFKKVYDDYVKRSAMDAANKWIKKTGEKAVVKAEKESSGKMLGQMEQAYLKAESGKTPAAGKTSFQLEQDFIRAIQSWKGSSRAIQKDITNILSGKEPADPSSATAKFAQRIIDHLISDTKPSPTLRRGVKFYEDQSIDQFASMFVEGKDIDLPASSFSTSKKVADEFAATTNLKGRFMITMENSHGLRIENIGGSHAEEKEWISGGRFLVVSKTRAASGEWDIVIRQTITLAGKRV